MGFILSIKEVVLLELRYHENTIFYFEKLTIFCNFSK